tara:strand:- start:119 stop:718 length:600 start_codon:yes stop_codon:yes gene_type:complete
MLLKKIKYNLTIVPLIALLAISCATSIEEPNEETGDISMDTEYYAFIKLADADENELGIVKIQLHSDKVPKTVENFVKLSKDGFYDGVIFHRVIPGFMAQSGDPEGTGRGGPGYTFNDEFHPELTHNSKGILSMANAGPNTNGSQFFITYGPTPHLDNMHSVFGKVIEGMDLIDAIPARDPSMIGEPAVKMLSIEIREN